MAAPQGENFPGNSPGISPTPCTEQSLQVAQNGEYLGTYVLYQ